MPRYWLKPSGNIKTGTRAGTTPAWDNSGCASAAWMPLSPHWETPAIHPSFPPYWKKQRELFDNALAELEKAKKLEPEDYLSHFRAITMATEAIGSREAVPVLLAMLTTPGVRGHSILSFAEARSNAVPDLNDTSTRNLALKELHLARALYLCGDQDGIGEEVLRRYADGLQGHYARYAQEILNSK